MGGAVTTLAVVMTAATDMAPKQRAAPATAIGRHLADHTDLPPTGKARRLDNAGDAEEDELRKLAKRVSKVDAATVEALKD